MNKSYLALTVTIATLTLAACGASDTQEDKESQFQGFPSVQAEYKTTLEKLTFPDDYTPPSETVEATPGTLYEKGEGIARAQNVWQCAWQGAYVKTLGQDETANTHALDMLDKALDMEFTSEEYLAKQSRELMIDDLKRARLGDASPIQASYKANCQ